MSVEEAKCLTTQIGGSGLGIKLLLKKLLPNPPSLDPPLTPISRGAVLPSYSFFRESVYQSTFFTADSEFCFLILLKSALIYLLSRFQKYAVIFSSATLPSSLLLRFQRDVRRKGCERQFHLLLLCGPHHVTNVSCLRKQNKTQKESE